MGKVLKRTADLLVGRLACLDGTRCIGLGRETGIMSYGDTSFDSIACIGMNDHSNFELHVFFLDGVHDSATFCCLLSLNLHAVSKDDPFDAKQLSKEDAANETGLFTIDEAIVILVPSPEPECSNHRRRGK